MEIERFRDIRPYSDEEVKDVLARLQKDPGFWEAVSFFFKEDETDQIKQILGSVQSSLDFQKSLIYTLLKRICDNSVEELTYGGSASLHVETPHLFISNHRDIVLDSALINRGYFEKVGRTLEIAIGSNLLKLPWVTDLVKLNKSFVVYRDLPMNEMLEAANLLSDYIKYTITRKKESIWIAQREGRSKDGNDATHPGLIKMIGLSASGDIIDHFKKLHIIPVAISYEYDPCDLMKLPELMANRAGEEYNKKPDEDHESMKQGILGWKGRVHVQYGKPLDDALNNLDGNKPVNEVIRDVTDLIDRSIHENYKLWPTNKEAAAILDGDLKINDLTDERFAARLKGLGTDEQEALLEMYANPVRNAMVAKGKAETK